MIFDKGWPCRGPLLPGLLACLLACGCAPSYPRIHSRESLEILLALRTACSTQNPERLQKVEKALDQARKAGNLSQEEADALYRIIELAREGHWQQADRACRAFQKAQVR